MPEGPLTVRIERYSVQLGAFASLDPGRAPSQNAEISLSAAPGQAVEGVLLFFKVDAPPKLGWINPTRTLLVAFLPPEAFVQVYGVLQAEEPVFVQYALKDDGDLEAFHLTTTDEPVGEGRPPEEAR